MDSFTAALSRLDPASRALLDLSLRRGMRPEEISDLLGTEPESVVVAREGALEQLAGELGMENVSQLDEVRTRLAELPAEAWTGEARRPKLAVVKNERPLREEEPRAPERKSRVPWLLALLAIVAVVLVVVLASSGGSDSKKTASTPAPSKPSASKPKPSKPQPKPGPQVALVPVSGAGGAHGSATLTQGGRRLRIDVTGLPDPHGGAYQVWLYDSVIDAASLTKVSGTKLTLDLKLPRNASHYRYVDISLEPADGNPNHSGESVLRVPLAKLSR